MTGPEPSDPTLVPARHADRTSSDRAALDDLLDSCLVAHVGLVAEHGPVVIPTAYARDGDQLLLHGSTGSRWMRALADGDAACVSVTQLRALVVARSAFESSMHYASAVLFGRCSVITGAAKLAALDVITDHLIPGRTAQVRRPTPRELAATLVLALPIEQWSFKTSDGWPQDGPDDVAGPAWAGVLPLVTSWGTPRPAPDLAPGIAVPAQLAALAQLAVLATPPAEGPRR